MAAWCEKAEELEERMVKNALVEKMAVQQLKDEEELRFQMAKRRLESGMAPLSSYARASYMSLGAGALSGIPNSATLRIRNSLSPYLQTSKGASMLALLGQPVAAQNATELGRISNISSQASQVL